MIGKGYWQKGRPICELQSISRNLISNLKWLMSGCGRSAAAWIRVQLHSSSFEAHIWSGVRFGSNKYAEDAITMSYVTDTATVGPRSSFLPNCVNIKRTRPVCGKIGCVFEFVTTPEGCCAHAHAWGGEEVIHLKLWLRTGQLTEYNDWCVVTQRSLRIFDSADNDSGGI